jgi:hypothetical protein
VPLRPEDLLFPEEGDQFVSTKGHIRDCSYLEGVAEDFADAHPGTLAFREHRIDFGVQGIQPLLPDLSLFKCADEWDINRGTFPVKPMRAKSLLTLEVSSGDTRRNDLVLKPDLYYRAKVPLYVIIDRRAGRSRNELRLLAYRAARGGYVPLAPDEHGRIWLEPLEMWLGIEKDRAICYDKDGNRIAPANEQARQAKAQATELAKRVADLEAQLRRGRK